GMWQTFDLCAAKDGVAEGPRNRALHRTVVSVEASILHHELHILSLLVKNKRRFAGHRSGIEASLANAGIKCQRGEINLLELLGQNFKKYFLVRAIECE